METHENILGSHEHIEGETTKPLRYKFVILTGVVMIVIAACWGVLAYTMPLTGTNGTVYNIGAIADVQINIMCAGILFVSGILLLGFGLVLNAISDIGQGI